MERELLLLGLLRGQDMHGYQLAEFINRDLAFCTDLKKPTAYYLLDKMAEAGWVTHAEEQDGGRPVRRVYALTPEGEAAFWRLLRENLAAHHATYFAGDIGLTFLDALPPAEAHTLLRQRRDGLVAALADVEAVPPHSGSIQWAIDHRLHHLRAELAWIDALLAQLQAQA